MPGFPLRSVPTGAGVPAEGTADPPPELADGVVDLAAETLDTDLAPAGAATAVGTTAVVVAASLLDFLR